MTGNLAGRVLGLIALAASLSAMDEPPAAVYARIVGEARAARERQDFPSYLAHLRMLVDILPGHPASHYSLARGLTLTGDRPGALATLDRLADMGFAYDPTSDPAFETLRGDPAFGAVTARLAANGARRGGPAVPAALGLAGRQPEGVARIDDGAFLIGTLDGALYRFDARSGDAPRLLASIGSTVAGIRPDEATGTYLACVSDEANGRALVQRRRLADSALVAMYPLPSTGGFCNDVALIAGGFAVTDSNNGIVYRLSGGRLVPLAIPPLFFPNGIASDPRTGRLFVAHGNGIMSIDVASGEARPLATEGTLLAGIDGMVWHHGALIAMQNVVAPPRLLRITIAPDGRAASVAPILSGDPQLAGATTVAVDGGDALVLSQTGIPNGTLPDAPILLRVPL